MHCFFPCCQGNGRKYLHVSGGIYDPSYLVCWCGVRSLLFKLWLCGGRIGQIGNDGALFFSHLSEGNCHWQADLGEIQSF